MKIFSDKKSKKNRDGIDVSDKYWEEIPDRVPNDAPLKCLAPRATRLRTRRQPGSSLTGTKDKLTSN